MILNGHTSTRRQNRSAIWTLEIVINSATHSWMSIQTIERTANYHWWHSQNSMKIYHLVWARVFLSFCFSLYSPYLLFFFFPCILFSQFIEKNRRQVFYFFYCCWLIVIYREPHLWRAWIGVSVCALGLNGSVIRSCSFNACPKSHHWTLLHRSAYAYWMVLTYSLTHKLKPTDIFCWADHEQINLNGDAFLLPSYFVG